MTTPARPLRLPRYPGEHRVQLRHRGRDRLRSAGQHRPQVQVRHRRQVVARAEGGQHIGVVLAISPEQVGGEPVDSRSDVYSLGLTLYEMLTLRPAFEALTTTRKSSAASR